jgi:dsRNA-specific ribonuclease
MTVVDAIIKWITDEEKLNMFYMSNDSKLLDSLLSNKPKNLRHVFVSINFKDKAELDAKYPGILLKIESDFKTKNKKPFLLFNDFEGTSVIMSDNNNTYSRNIEWDSFFRKFCRRIINFNYKGSKIIDGYWSDENIETYDNLRFLKISKWGNMCQRLPVPVPAISDSNKVFNSETSKQYIADLEKFIRELLTILLEDEEGDNTKLIDSFLSVKAMSTWTLAFIHVTQNATHNNDSLEHRGDRVFHGDFARYMHDKFPGINSHEGSSFHQHYLSGSYQKYWSDDLNLFDRLIKNKNVRGSPKIRTDCLEAFVGALDEIASSIQNGLNYVIGSKFLYMLSDSIPFNKELKFGIPKHKITQINESLGFKRNDLVIEEIKMINGHKCKDEGGEFSILVTKVENNNLARFYEDKTLESNIRGNRTLSSITRSEIQFKYYHGKMPSEDAHTEIWKIISDIYDSYDISLSTKKNKEDPIFEKIKKNEPLFFDELKKKLFESFPEDNNSFESFEFIINRDDGYVIFYMRKKENAIKPNSNMAEDYQTDIAGLTAYENIAVYPFIFEPIKIGNVTLTTLESSKYSLLRSYISSGA